MSKTRRISLILMSIALVMALCLGFQFLSANAVDTDNDQPYRIVEERNTENGFYAILEFDITEE